MSWFYIVAALFVLILPCSAKDVLCATWNMKWFPSGRADMRRDNFFEETITADNASKILSSVYREMVPNNDADIVVFAQEMRDREWCARLIEKSYIPDLRIASISDFRDNAGVTLWQQTVVMSTLPVVDAGFTPWQGDENVDVPRGYSYAVLKQEGGDLVACFSIHLKSNLNVGNKPIETKRNIYKREISAHQVLAKLRELQQTHGSRLTRAVVAGDFNTNEDEKAFVSESTLRSFFGAHFRSCFREPKRLTG